MAVDDAERDGVEEMAASINEIAQQVSKSSDMAKAAVEEAERTNATMQSLAEGSRRSAKWSI